MNCVLLCHVMGKYAISHYISNKLYTYHLLLLIGLFSRLSGLGLCFLFAGFMGSVFTVNTNLQHSLMPRHLCMVLSRMTVIYSKKNFCLHFVVGLAIVSFPNLPYSPKKKN